MFPSETGSSSSLFRSFHAKIFGNVSAKANYSCGSSFATVRSRISIGEGWEGIPVNLVLNSLLFTFMIVVFTCLRKKAWNHKSRQLTRTHKGWLQFIYGDRDEEVKQLSSASQNEHHVHDLNQLNPLLPPSVKSAVAKLNRSPIQPSSPSPIPTTPLPGGHLEDSSNIVSSSDCNGAASHNYEAINGDTQTDDAKEASADLEANTESIPVRIGHRIRDILVITDEDILRQKGSDAVQYLIFQRYIIYFLLLLTVVCVFVILPVNLQGSAGSTKFSRTTIANLTPESDLLWVHVVISMLVLPLGLLLMCHFAKTIKADDEQVVRRTLFIRRIPKSKRSKETLVHYFSSAFPEVVIEGIQFVYDTRKLNSLHLEYNSVVNAKYYCDEYLAEYNKRCYVRPYFLGHLGCLVCCGCEKLDGVNFYSTKEQELERDLEKEFRYIISHPSGSVFITFQTEKMAQRVYKVLRENQEKSCSFCTCCSCCLRVGLWALRQMNCVRDDDFRASRWSVSYAPYPDDINWDDVSVDYKMLWLRRILIHLLLLVFFFFLSTPAIVLSTLNHINVTDTIKSVSNWSPVLGEYVSPLVMVIASIILPTFVTLACQYLPYKTLSELNHSIMWKVFLYLVMMVIVLPSLSLGSTTALLNKLANNSTEIQWQCLFPVDSGAFFVNYVLQSTLLGNAMELLRFPELFLYFFYLIFSSRTQAEYEGARKLVIFDFAFGVRYPRYLLIFTMVVTYSLSCPLIVPCGLLYMIIKHLVDRYNIYYVYVPSKISGRIHSTAIMFFHIAILMMQFQMFAFSFLKNKDSNVTNLSIINFIIATLVFSGHCFFHFFWNINHLTYMAVARNSSKKCVKKEFCACSYLPRVLYNINVNGIVPPDSQANKNYGSVGVPRNIPNNNSSQKLDIATVTT